MYTDKTEFMRFEQEGIISILRSKPMKLIARGVMVIVVGNGHGDTSSNPGRDWLHFT